MRISTLICAAAFLAFVLHGRYDFPGIGGRPKAASHRLVHASVENSSTGSASLNEIDRRMAEVRSMLAKMERTERLLAERLAELEGFDDAAAGRRPGRPAARAAGKAALCEQLEEVRVERDALLATLERLKTEHVRFQAQQEIRQTAAKARAIEGFLGAGGGGGPLEGIAGDLEREARRSAAAEDLARREAF